MYCTLYNIYKKTNNISFNETTPNNNNVCQQIGGKVPPASDDAVDQSESSFSFLC